MIDHTLQVLKAVDNDAILQAIQLFSGTAMYSTTFGAISPGVTSIGRRLFLAILPDIDSDVGSQIPEGLSKKY